MQGNERAALAAIATRLPLGQRTVERLRRGLGSLEAARRAGLPALFDAGLRPERARRIMESKDVDGETLLRDWQARGLRFLAFDEPEYPDAWRRLAIPPSFVLVEGDPAALRAPLVAIIGTRHPTAYGERIARQLVETLVSRKFGTVAGLAVGIDTVAHIEALRLGLPTAAVLAGGHARFYPRANRGLGREIAAAGGAVLSEVVPETEALRQRFVARNRLVAALARCVVVVEAGEPSGTMTTVRHALDLGIEVFAVPGPISSPVSAGCHRLLQDGATLLDRPERLGEWLGEHAREDEDSLLARIRRAPATLIELSAEGELPAAEMLSQLSVLELQGAIRRDADGRYLTV